MKTRTKVLSATAAGLMAWGAFALIPAAPAGANPFGGYGHGDGHEYSRGWHHGDRHGPGAMCGRSGRMVERMERLVGIMGLTDAQQAAWRDLSTTARTAADRLEATCKQAKDDGDAKATAPERLARMEAMTAAGLDALREVRPRFDAFYATLSDAQKQALDEMGPRHRRGQRDGDRDRGRG